MMEIKVYYAKSTRGFYRSGDKLPSDAVEITQERLDELMLQQEQGLIIVPGDDGYPVAIENVKDPVEAATELKAILIRTASETIAPMKDALDGGYIEESDKQVLLDWQKYRYALTKIDISTAPNIEWPKVPDSQAS